MKIKKLMFSIIGFSFSSCILAQNMGQGNMFAETRVQEICELSATQLNFGIIDFVGTGGSVSIPGTLSIRCTKGVNYKAKVSQEGVASDGFRKLKNINNESSTANYNVYIKGTDELFGDGFTGRVIEGMGTGLKEQIRYEARINFDQTVEPGYYRDLINIFVDY